MGNHTNPMHRRRLWLVSTSLTQPEHAENAIRDGARGTLEDLRPALDHQTY